MINRIQLQGYLTIGLFNFHTIFSIQLSYFPQYILNLTLFLTPISKTWKLENIEEYYLTCMPRGQKSYHKKLNG